MRVKLLFLAALFILAFFSFTVSVRGDDTSVTRTTDSASITTKPLPLIKEKREMIIKNRQDTRAIFKDKKEEFREKLQTIREEKKRAIVQRIDEKISRMNNTHTARFSKVLEKLEMILNRTTEQAQNLKSKGVDTSQVDSAIVSAKTAIEAAKAAVIVQTAKTYIIEIAGETTLKRTVGSIVSVFRKDLRDVHKAVVDAKQAVQNAEMELVKVGGEQKGAEE